MTTSRSFLHSVEITRAWGRWKPLRLLKLLKTVEKKYGCFCPLNLGDALGWGGGYTDFEWFDFTIHCTKPKFLNLSKFDIRFSVMQYSRQDAVDVVEIQFLDLKAVN